MLQLRSLLLYVTAFVCGWVMMGLEILGGRVLSPDFGSGVFVWGSVIGVFLLSLSTGYLIGGWASSRWPLVAVLAGVILAAALSIVPVALWYPEISGWFAALEWNERYGALAAAAALFFLPSTLLGMVSPYCIRLLTTSVEKSGASAGTLYAISTVGSFLGCIHTAFYLIVSLGIRHCLFAGAGVLGALGLVLVVVSVVGSRTKKAAVADSGAGSLAQWGDLPELIKK
ncbi:fused MFS/spermidine synthase [Thermogutta sp.]|jgi:MFS family permease|uniref:fused MFS/spermidine synthase n=1 Tax=Thermogutta sp. TaxID=1962930 RepID=UPI0032201D34